MNLWTEHFKVFHLVQIMRQKECVDFAMLLNRLRQCKHTYKDIDILKTRTISTDVMHPDYPRQIFLMDLQMEQDVFSRQLVILPLMESSLLSGSNLKMHLLAESVEKRTKLCIPME